MSWLSLHQINCLTDEGPGTVFPITDPKFFNTFIVVLILSGPFHQSDIL